MEQEVLTVRRESKLGKYVKSEDIYYQKSKDYEGDGEPFDTLDVSKQGLMGTLQNLTPHWNFNQNRWAFAGEYQDLYKIAKELKLTDKQGKIIEPDENSVFNRFDPFFGHKSLWTSTFMEDNMHSLNSKNVLDRFYTLVLKGREDIDDPTATVNKKSKLDTERSGLVLNSNAVEKIAKGEKVDEEMEAMKHFINLSTNWDKLKRIASIMNPPGYVDSYNDQTALKVLIKTSVIDHDEVISKYGMSPRKYFIKLCNLDNATLDIYANITRALQQGILRVSGGKGATLMGVPIAEGGIKSEQTLIAFYLSSENVKLYDDLCDLIAERDNIPKEFK